MNLRLGEITKVPILALLGLIIVASYSSVPWADATNVINAFPPDARPYGVSLGEWVAKSWQRVFSMPSDSDSPAGMQDAINSCVNNQEGPVWILEGSGGEGGVVERVCTIPAGKALLIPILSGMCSYADTPNAKSESDLRECAMSGDEGASIEVRINGVRLDNIDSYRLQTSPFDLNVPNDNPFGVRPGLTTAVADCWCLMLEPLPVGRHVIQYTVSIVGNPTIGMSSFASDVTQNLIVQEQQFAITPYSISIPDIDHQIFLPINSSSTVSDFSFNTQTKQISFRVSSEDSIADMIIFPISRLLQGPYTVTLDGNMMTNFETINNQTSNETSIKISHNQGIHDIVVVGTNVIPEFPNVVVNGIILASAIGIIMILRRVLSVNSLHLGP